MRVRIMLFRSPPIKKIKKARDVVSYFSHTCPAGHVRGVTDIAC